MWLLACFADSDGDRAVDPAQRLFRLADGRQVPRAAVPALVRGSSRHRSAGLEAVYDRAAGLQRRAVRVRLRRAVPAAVRAAEPARPRLARADDDLQHGHILYDQHQSAALFGRPALLEFQPDRSSSCRTCSCRRRSVSARLAAIIRAFRGEATVGNFFVDMWRVAHVHLSCPSRLSSASSSCRRACR